MQKRDAVVGFIGLGLMGVPMSLRLLQAGFELHVWNRSAAKQKPLVDAGARAAASISELVKLCDVILLCVADSAAVEAVVCGDNGAAGNVLGALRKGQVIVDFSSIAPDTTRQLAAQVAEKHAHWIDAPVSGGVIGAQQGSLAVMCGGSEAVLQSVMPVLQPLSQRVTHMGPVGSGQITKIANQMLVSCNLLVMAEVMAMVQRAGVDAGRIPQALKGGFADSTPLQLTGPRMAAADFAEVKWHVRTLLKDLDLAGDFARQLGAAIPMAGLGAELMRQHASRGFLEQDPATLIRLYQPDSA